MNEAVAVNAIKLMARVDAVYVEAMTTGEFQAQAVINTMPTKWVVRDTPEEAIVIACSRALEDYDPSPWCQYCGSMTEKGCDCGPIADNH